MTLIIGIASSKEVLLGADSVDSNGWTARPLAQEKIVRLDVLPESRLQPGPADATSAPTDDGDHHLSTRRRGISGPSTQTRTPGHPYRCSRPYTKLSW